MSNNLVETLQGLDESEDPRTIPEMKAEAQDYTDGILKGATRYTSDNGWSLDYRADGSNFGCGLMDKNNPNKIVPKEGDTIRVYGLFGSTIYGIDIDGH